MEPESERTITEDTGQGTGRDISGSTVRPSADAVGAGSPLGVQGDGEATRDDGTQQTVQRTERPDTRYTGGSDGISDGDPLGPGQRAVSRSAEVSEGAVTRTGGGDVANEPIRADSVVGGDPDGLELPIYW